MPAPRRSRILSALLLPSLLFVAAPATFAQPKPVAPPLVASATPPTEEDLISTREQVIALLRMSPTLTQVVETDPAILSDQDYVNRTNPQLAQYLTLHPEVVRNPTYYLFSNIPNQRGRRIESLHRNDDNGNNYEPPTDAQVRNESYREMIPMFAFIGFLGTFIWLIRIFLENRRWTRVFRLQSEVHAKLIDRFANNQELLHYMETEPGKRFLEAAPIPVAVDRNEPLPGGLARVLGPLQIGIVLSLLGIGLLTLQHSLPNLADGLQIFGMVTLMPGLGFIISALIAWRISMRLGLMPSPNQPNGHQ